MKKLSKTMEDMIKGAEIHEVRVGGEVVRRGYMIAGSINTVVALINRDVCTSNGVQHYGINWLTPAGVKILSHLTFGGEYPSLGEDITPEDHPTESDMITDTRDAWINRREAAIEADNARLAAEWDDVAAGEEHYESLNPEYRGDDEKTFDAENAAAEGADIRAEYEAEFAEESRVVDELIAEIYADDRLMHLTSKGVFVSGNYVETMRRISEESRDGILAWRSRQYESRLTMDDDFRVLDMMVDAGTMSFGMADRCKRRIRNICRPRIGPKRKPSGKRRNRR